MAGDKIGILTFHAAYNCGSMMQTYALDHFLSARGVRCEVIDFANDGQRNVYSMFARGLSIKNLVKNCIVWLYQWRIRANFASYEAFKREHFHLSGKRYDTAGELTDAEYAAVVAGSDQIWNITIEDGDDAYFLPWVRQARRVAYAPSFGAKNILRYAPDPAKYRRYLEAFDCLSVREKNGQKWIKELTGKDVPVVLDPTLLLDAADYAPVISQRLTLPERYIFYYSPGFSRDINRLVQQISKKYKLPVIAFNAKNFFVKGMQFGGFHLPTLENPATYLQLMQHATMVITTSFHGTIFSTVFRRTFWTVKNGGMFGDDDRVLTLMDHLTLEDRLIGIDFDPNFDYLREADYAPYQRNLESLREQSKAYLLSALRMD